MFAKLGGVYYDTKGTRSWKADHSQYTSEHGLEFYNGELNKSDSESGYTWLYDVGADVNIGDRWGLNLKWESYQDVKFPGAKDNIDMLSLSVDYSF